MKYCRMCVSGLALATGALVLVGCNTESTSTFGGQVVGQSREIRRLGEQWDEGARKMARGQDLIQEGERTIGRGRTMIREGQDEKRQAETAYQALGLPPPQAPEAAK